MTNVRALEQARAMLASGDAAGAERIVVAAFPESANAPADALYLMGCIRRGQGRLADARRFLAGAVEADAAQPLHHFTLGDLLARLGEQGAAAELFAEALRLDASFPNARRAFARAALNAGKAGEAEQAARELLAATPDADAWDILSCALRAQDRNEEALAAAEEALRLDETSVPARHDWAVAAGRLGRVDDALKAFEQLAARGVEASALSLNHGAALLELGRIGEAEAVLAAGVERWGLDTKLHSALAKARWLAGAGEAFTERLEDVIARNPNATSLRAACVDLLRAAGFAVRAERVLQNGLAHRPGDRVLNDALGALLEDAGRLDEAEPLLKGAVARAPDDEETRSLWIRTLLRMGRAEEVRGEIAPLRAARPHNQAWIAFDCLALRQMRDSRYGELCDYERMVQSYELPAPPGYRTIAEFNQALAASLEKLHVARSHPLGQTLRNGTQSGPSLTGLDDPIIKQYLAALEAPIREYTNSMQAGDHPWSGRNTRAFRIAGAWTVRLKAGGHHVNHVHPRGWISSAYYVALPEAMGEGEAGWIKFGEAPKPMPGCGVERFVRPETGKLVLFPSYFWHGTVPFAAGERLTAPFDVVPV